MLTRQPVGNTTRPAPPQRSFSGAPLALQPQASHRPTLPSRLSSVRSASGPRSYVDLTGDGSSVSNGHSWKRNMEQAGFGGPGDVIDLSDDPEDGRPGKKAKFESPALVEGSPELDERGDEVVKELDTAHEVVPGELLAPPPRPSALRSSASARKQRATDPARKSDGLTPPLMATRLPPPKYVADFYPWTGNHPEDVLSEQVIKAGYYDKPPGPSQNESNSARHSIWPNLSQKNNIGLQTLSHLFTQALEKRQNLGRCTAPSSFKPPPRVTVTDTKREAWLKDLANTNIPLRRQSRTIPHGIRGKLLMEQCLAKSIPLQRAVWLAKCVGANELRAFRRKGVSGSAAAQGEAKWVRDWTAQVEQFLESIISACGQDDWRKRIDYAIKLVSAFYSEGLLDKDEYLNWIGNSFTSAPVESLPLWTVIVQVYWRDLVRYGRGGRKLARAILEHLDALTEKRHPVFEPLKQRLQKLITVIAVTKRGCLVVADTWQKYKHLLDSEKLSLQNHALRPALTNIAQRNERLARPMERTMDNTRSPLLELYAKLDTVDLTTDFDDLSAQCVKTVPEAHELVLALLRWASTLYRRGRARILLAAKIIASMHRAGHDTDGAILAYIQLTTTASAAEMQNAWAVIAQLIQNDCFATGRYLQWLIASGAVSAKDQSSVATGLLSALPVESLPQHVRNLRVTLLRRLGQHEQESEQIEDVKAEMQQRLESSQMHLPDENRLLAALSASSKLSVGFQVRSLVAEMAKSTGMSVSALCILRDVLEQTDNLPVLADLVEAALSTENPALLASTTDTINMHALELAIQGHLSTLLDRLVERYRTLRSQVPLDRAFLIALANLVKRFPDRAALAAILANDLILYEQQHSAAVCSPASDSLIGMQAGSLNSDAEIDAVFASGNSMDEQTMQRVFLRVMQRAGKIETSPTAQQSRVGGWLSQLRDVDGSGLERLTKHYVAALLQRHQKELGAAQGLLALVSARCLSLDAIVRPLGQLVTTEVAATLLRLLASPVSGAGLSAPEHYSLRLQQERYCADHPDQVATLLGKASEDASFSIETDWVLDLALRTIVADPKKTFPRSTGDQASQCVTQASGRLYAALLCRGEQSPSTVSTLDPGHVIRSADALNAPFCVAWLRMYLDNQRMYLDNQRTASTGSEDSIKEALLKSVADQSQVWPLLLSAARPEMLKSIHEWAREQLLTSTLNGDETDREGAMTRFCEVLDVTYSAVQHEDDAQIITTLTERLKAQENQLHDIDVRGFDHQAKTHAVTRSLRSILHLCTLHSQNTGLSDAAQQSRAQLVAVLCSLLVHPRLQMPAALHEHIHDVAAIFADALPDSVLASLARAIPPALSMDARILSLLGCTSSPVAWLAIATRVQPPPPPTIPPQTQQQRALNSRQTALPQIASRVPGQTQAQPGSTARAGPRQQPVEWKYAPYPLRQWEIMADPTPIMGENDCSIGVGLFGGRKV